MFFLEAVERARPFLFVEISEFSCPHDFEAISRIRREDAGVGALVDEDHRRSDSKERNVDVPAGKRLDDVGARAEPLYRDIRWDVLIVALLFHHVVLHVRIDRDVRDRDRVE